MKKFTWLSIAMIIMGLLQAPLSFADEELENENLAKIAHVLDSLTPLINQAEQQQDKNLRIQFNYDALRSDITKIKQGVIHKWQSVSMEPRPVTPIQGDYLIMLSKHA